MNIFDPDLFSDFLRDVAIATNLGQNWQNDLPSASWRFGAVRNIAAPIQ